MPRRLRCKIAVAKQKKKRNKKRNAISTGETSGGNGGGRGLVGEEKKTKKRITLRKTRLAPIQRKNRFFRFIYILVYHTRI